MRPHSYNMPQPPMAHTSCDCMCCHCRVVRLEQWPHSLFTPFFSYTDANPPPFLFGNPALGLKKTHKQNAFPTYQFRGGGGFPNWHTKCLTICSVRGLLHKMPYCLTGKGGFCRQSTQSALLCDQQRGVSCAKKMPHCWTGRAAGRGLQFSPTTPCTIQYNTLSPPQWSCFRSS